MKTYPNLAAIDAEGHDPDQHVKLAFPYEIGRLAAGRLDRVIEVATRDGVVVQHDKFGGGIFTRQGRVHVEGPWRDVRVVMAAVEQLAEDLDLD